MPAIGDDGEQDIVAGLRRPLTHLDGLDAVCQKLLVELEGRRRRRGKDLAPAGGNRRHLHIFAQIVRHNDIREAPEHRDQFRDIHERCKTADGLVLARRLDFQRCERITEG